VKPRVVNICSVSCAHVRPQLVMLEENRLHIRTDSLNTCFQSLQCPNIALRIMPASVGTNSECMYH
jgi:hypothetical protein